LQLLPEKHDPSLVMKKVEVHITPEGQLVIYDAARRVNHYEVRAEERRLPVRTARRPQPSTSAAPDPRADARRRGWLYGKVR